MGAPIGRPISDTSFPAARGGDWTAKPRAFTDSEFEDDVDVPNTFWNLASAGWALALEGAWLAYAAQGTRAGFSPLLPIVMGVAFLIVGVLLGFTVSPRFTAGGYAAAGAGVILGAYMLVSGSIANATTPLTTIPLVAVAAECIVGPVLGVVGWVLAVRAEAREQ
jgi:FtsH-binding integral membrane protein